MQYIIGAGGCLLILSLAFNAMQYTQTMVRPDLVKPVVCPSIAALALQAHEDNAIQNRLDELK
jgi:hypothetical protein